MAQHVYFLGEEELDRIEKEESQKKRDIANVSRETIMNDDQKSPQQKKKKENKDAEQRLYHDIIAHSKLLKAIGEERDREIISLISCYMPVLRDCPDQAIETMTKISCGWTNRKEKIIKAINYVKYGEKKRTGK